jgi:hypothetical protein
VSYDDRHANTLHSPTVFSLSGAPFFFSLLDEGRGVDRKCQRQLDVKLPCLHHLFIVVSALCWQCLVGIAVAAIWRLLFAALWHFGV